MRAASAVTFEGSRLLVDRLGGDVALISWWSEEKRAPFVSSLFSTSWPWQARPRAGPSVMVSLGLVSLVVLLTRAAREHGGGSAAAQDEDDDRRGAV